MILRPVFLFIFILCVIAGVWQYQRAQFHIKLSSSYEQLQQTDYQEFNLTQLADIQQAYQKIKITLSYESSPHFLLDNQIQNKQVGYTLLTPYTDGQQVLLIDRGWLPKKNQMQINQFVSESFPKVTWYGVWKKYHQPINWLYSRPKDTYFQQTVSRIIPYIDGKLLQPFFSDTLVLGVLQAESAKPAIAAKNRTYSQLLTSHISKAPSPYPFTKNYAYMGQWIIFSLFAFTLFIRTFLNSAKK